ncbi:MAG: preprotein translocase subunit SecD, partial [Actinomycetota bacterium]|nr:preprotein translocase subunit SecD [Actinomycetota bacterium]
MASPTATRPGRTIAALLVLAALVYGLIYFLAPDRIGTESVTLAKKYMPRLGLDLEGGTSVILTPRVAPGETGTITSNTLNQAVAIIRNRVDSFGVAEAEVTTAGKSIVISVPGKQDKNILET